MRDGANRAHLAGGGSEVRLEGMQAQALVANVYKHVTAAIEGAEWDRSVDELTVHGDGKVLKHFVQRVTCGQDTDCPLLTNDLHTPTQTTVLSFQFESNAGSVGWPAQEFELTILGLPG